jgi:hypothetical protein
MNLSELMENMLSEAGKAQYTRPQDRVAVIKILAKELEKIIWDKPPIDRIKEIAEIGYDLIDKKVSVNTIVMDLGKYLRIEKSIGLKRGQLALKKDIDDLLTIICLWSREEADKFATETAIMFGKGYKEEEIVNWVKNKTKGQLEDAIKRYEKSQSNKENKK